MTLEEKIEVIKAYAEGKAVEVYDKYSNEWFAKEHNAWDFDVYKYRIKPDETTKFKVGDKLVDKGADGEENPIRFELTSIVDGIVKLDDCWDCSLEELYERYISVEDVLWYFEIYDYGNKTWRLLTDRRFTIREANDLFASSHDTSKWRPMYSLGFALKDN